MYARHTGTLIRTVAHGRKSSSLFGVRSIQEGFQYRGVKVVWTGSPDPGAL